MIRIRQSKDRGHTQLDWLSSYHTFSFGTYNNPQFLGVRDLLVVNEDVVLPGKGFGRHAHKDMEIISYVVKGQLTHQDSLQNTMVLRAGDVQRMTAGTGVFHSEMNGSLIESVHFLQMWVLPEKQGLSPEYEQKHFSLDQKKNQFRLMVSPSGEEGSLKIHQDVWVYGSCLEENQSLQFSLRLGRYLWLQLIEGSLLFNKNQMQSGDGAFVSDETAIFLQAQKSCEFVMFDLR